MSPSVDRKTSDLLLSAGMRRGGICYIKANELSPAIPDPWDSADALARMFLGKTILLKISRSKASKDGHFSLRYRTSHIQVCIERNRDGTCRALHRWGTVIPLPNALVLQGDVVAYANELTDEPEGLPTPRKCLFFFDLLATEPGECWLQLDKPPHDHLGIYLMPQLLSV